MNSKQALQELIRTIKNKTGLTQFEIAVKAGYTGKYLSQILSTGNISDKTFENLRKTFRLDNTTSEESTETPSRSDFHTLVENNKVITQAHKEITAAHHELSIAHNKIAATNELLTGLLQNAIAEKKGETLEAAQPIHPQILELLLEEGLKSKRWRSKQEALAEVHRIMYGNELKKAGKGIPHG